MNSASLSLKETYHITEKAKEELLRESSFNMTKGDDEEIGTQSLKF